MTAYAHIQGRREIPRFCPKCGEPGPFATEQTIWCGRCTWTVQRYERGRRPEESE